MSMANIGEAVRIYHRAPCFPTVPIFGSRRCSDLHVCVQPDDEYVLCPAARNGGAKIFEGRLERVVDLVPLVRVLYCRLNN